MPQFSYRGRDKDGSVRSGIRFSTSIENLNNELINEGISPIKIVLSGETTNFWQKIASWLSSETLHADELAIFARQMKLLHQAGVPMVTALKQLSQHTRSKRLAHALDGVITHLEKGQSLATAMQQYPGIFSPLIVNLVRIGENTGRLSESFEHIHHYLAFEASNAKQIKNAFRYPTFVLISIFCAIVILNIFVVPTFGRFYSNLTVALPWQTQLLINSSNLFINYGAYLLALIIIAFVFLIRYLQTPEGKYRWGKFVIQVPIFGKLMKRIILIRFTESLSIMLKAGLSVVQGLGLVKEIILNAYIMKQIERAQEAIERGAPFTQAIDKIDLLTPIELQILAVGEKNGDLSPALNYISAFQGEEIEYDLKRMSDLIGPIMIAAVSVLVLIIALGVYLPIWNMINLVHS